MAELVTDYLEGVLPPRRWLGARLHLLRCDACTRYFDQIRRTVALLRRYPRPSPPSAVEDAVMRQLHEPGTPP